MLGVFRHHCHFRLAFVLAAAPLVALPACSDLIGIEDRRTRDRDPADAGLDALTAPSVDATLAPYVRGKDYDRDGRYDLLLHDQDAGETRVWFLHGTARARVAPVREQSTQVVHKVTNWQFVATGDFDLDRSTDLVLYESDPPHRIQVWMMSGADRVRYAPVFEVLNKVEHQIAPPWKIVGTGDFDRDGKVDLLWQNGETGALQAWFMQDTGRTGFAYVREATTQEASVLAAPGRVANVADFDGDGWSDLLVQDGSTGGLSVWTMMGIEHVGTQAIVDRATGKPCAVTSPLVFGDTGFVDDDDRVDIVLQNPTSGEVLVWFLSGAERIGQGKIEDEATHETALARAPWKVLAQ